MLFTELYMLLLERRLILDFSKNNMCIKIIEISFCRMFDLMHARVLPFYQRYINQSMFLEKTVLQQHNVFALENVTS